MRPRIAIAAAVGIAGALATHDALAHPIDLHLGGFEVGFAHPFLGLDHVLAMMAAGVWAAQLGARARTIVPVAFIAAMACGAAFALTTSVALPYVEAGVAATVLAIGLLIALALRVPAFLGAMLVTTFAAWHGYAHGIELPATAAPSSYVLGFMLASVLLVGTGLAAGRANLATPWRARTIGGCVAAVGLALLSTA